MQQANDKQTKLLKNTTRLKMAIEGKVEIALDEVGFSCSML